MLSSLTRNAGKCKAILSGYSFILLFWSRLVNKHRITTLLTTASVIFIRPFMDERQYSHLYLSLNRSTISNNFWTYCFNAAANPDPLRMASATTTVKTVSSVNEGAEGIKSKSTRLIGYLPKRAPIISPEKKSRIEIDPAFFALCVIQGLILPRLSRHLLEMRSRPKVFGFTDRP